MEGDVAAIHSADLFQEWMLQPPDKWINFHNSLVSFNKVIVILLKWQILTAVCAKKCTEYIHSSTQYVNGCMCYIMLLSKFTEWCKKYLFTVFFTVSNVACINTVVNILQGVKSQVIQHYLIQICLGKKMEYWINSLGPPSWQKLQSHSALRRWQLFLSTWEARASDTNKCSGVRCR